MVQCLNGRQVSALLALPPLAALLDALDAESPDKVRDKLGSLFMFGSIELKYQCRCPPQ